MMDASETAKVSHVIAKLHRVAFMEKVLREGKVTGAPTPLIGHAQVFCNGVFFTEPEHQYPSEHMVAQVALGLETG